MIDELDWLRDQRSDEAPPDPQVTSAAKARLMATIAAGSREKPIRNRARRGRGWALRVGLAALAGAIGLLTVGRLSGGNPEPDPAAAAVLNRLARVAAVQRSSAPPAGEYLYTRSRTAYSSGLSSSCALIEPGQREIWTGADGSGLIRTTPLATVRYFSAADQAACRAQGYPPAADLARNDTWFAPGCLGLAPVNLSSLPLDPGTLRAALETGRVEGGPKGSAEAFTQVGDLLRETDASPQLRAALYRAAAGLPGVRLLGTVTDPIGRRGIALAHADDASGATLDELIFDPRTGALLAERQTATSTDSGVPGARAGTVVGSAVYVTSHVVKRLPAGGPGRLSPPCVDHGGFVRPYPRHPGSTIITGSSARPEAGTPHP
jgi:hypothetical protein